MSYLGNTWLSPTLCKSIFEKENKTLTGFILETHDSLTLTLHFSLLCHSVPVFFRVVHCGQLKAKYTWFFNLLGSKVSLFVCVCFQDFEYLKYSNWQMNISNTPNFRNFRRVLKLRKFNTINFRNFKTRLNCIL